MKIYRAISLNARTQGFGRENTNPDVLSIYEGMGMLGHNGWDWLAPTDSGLYFDCDINGIVTNVSEDSNGGRGIKIRTEDKDGIFQHRYWHLREANVRKGQIVETGDLIGWNDSTGKSTGPHLHRDLKPLTKIADGIYKNTYQNNGYFGAIEMAPYFQSIFVVDLMNNLKKKVGILAVLVSAYGKLIGLLKVVKTTNK